MADSQEDTKGNNTINAVKDTFSDRNYGKVFDIIKSNPKLAVFFGGALGGKLIGSGGMKAGLVTLASYLIVPKVFNFLAPKNPDPNAHAKAGLMDSIKNLFKSKEDEPTNEVVDKTQVSNTTLDNKKEADEVEKTNEITNDLKNAADEVNKVKADVKDVEEAGHSEPPVEAKEVVEDGKAVSA